MNGQGALLSGLLLGGGAVRAMWASQVLWSRDPCTNCFSERLAQRSPPASALFIFPSPLILSKRRPSAPTLSRPAVYCQPGSGQLSLDSSVLPCTIYETRVVLEDPGHKDCRMGRGCEENGAWGAAIGASAWPPWGKLVVWGGQAPGLCPLLVPLLCPILSSHTQF